MDANLRVFCGHQDYLSHSRVAQDYQRLIAGICTVVADPADAQVALLHYEPSQYARLLEDVPALRDKYLIGYCVWESSHLPRSLLGGIAMMDELWTASFYCLDIFKPSHPNVTWVPHLVSYPGTFSADDRKTLHGLVDFTQPSFNYLTIGTAGIMRKNTRALKEAFAYVAKRVPNARLIVKSIRYPIRPDARPQVIVDGPIVTLEGPVSAGVLAALYAESDVYASAHCSEGWGLPLSDAMALGLPVVATGFSGNMDFMTRHNALLVNYTLQAIRPQDTYYLFDSTMQWAYVHRESLERQLILAHRMIGDGSVEPMLKQAKTDIANYDEAHLVEHLQRRLNSIANGLRSGALHKQRRR